MQLLQMIQNVCWEDQTDDYSLTISRSRDLIRASSLVSRASGQEMKTIATESGHVLFRPHDPYNRYCDHILIYDRKQNRLAASARVLAWEHIAHLDPIGGFVTQGLFDLSGLSDSLPKTLELSQTYIEPEYRNGQVMMKLWSAMLRLLEHYDARYLMGVLSLNRSSAMHDVRSLLCETEQMKINDCTRPILARYPIGMDALSPVAQAESSKFHTRAQLQAVGACLGQEANADEGQQNIDFFVRVDVEKLIPYAVKQY